MQPSRFFVLAMVIGLLPAGCRRSRGYAAPPGKPPLEVFVPGEWRSPKGDVVVHPPDAALRPFRVMMLQETPRPKKNSRWKTIPSSESGELEMSPGSHFRCLYNPASFRAWPDEQMRGVQRWEVLRGVRCSSDGFRTYSQGMLSITYGPGGDVRERSAEQAELYLSETVNGQPVQITILLRQD